MPRALTFKALAALLSYPEQELVDALPELAAALDSEKLVPPRERKALGALIAELAQTELMTLQERYVGLFDRSRELSLHLFEHVHGESRERGQAMVDLGKLYASHGFALEGNELPDFLPAVLEYLSYRPAAEAQVLLADMAHILQVLGGRLARRANAYSAVLAALVRLAGEKPAFDPASGGTSPESESAAAIDESWAEPPAFGGRPGDAQVAPVRFYPKGAAR
ncbi:MAG: nitrate reductase molybdenum cofactor assembly chaperone [Burkholderiales bacterium]